MKIVLEGPDNSGKSTLAQYLSSTLGLELIHSGGPSKYPGEVNYRSDGFNEISVPVIFDRHPCVSQNIYQDALGNTEGERVTEDRLRAFYDQKPFIIYCRNPGTLDGHQMSEHSSDEYFEQVTQNFQTLCRLYDEWALPHAHHIYRIGDDMKKLALMIGDLIWGPDGHSHMFDPVRDVEDFHRKFGQLYDGPPRLLPTTLGAFRCDFMFEELHEYLDSSVHGQKALGAGHLTRVREELEVQLDSLVDLAYVVLGTSQLQGFNFREAWRRVHEANMQKVAAMKDGTIVEGVIDSGRNKEFDIVKPVGWKAPSHEDLVAVNAHNEKGAAEGRHESLSPAE